MHSVITRNGNIKENLKREIRNGNINIHPNHHHTISFPSHYPSQSLVSQPLESRKEEGATVLCTWNGLRQIGSNIDGFGSILTRPEVSSSSHVML